MMYTVNQVLIICLVPLVFAACIAALIILGGKASDLMDDD